MASTYTTSLKIQEIGNGEQSGVWGSTTNTNWNLMEQAVAGVQTITMANANYTLSNLNGTLDEARNAVLVVVGTNSGVYQVIAPLLTKTFIVSNQTSGGNSITIGGASGSVITIPNGVTAQVYCDGTNFYSAQTGSAGNFLVNGNLSVTGNQVDVGNMSVSGTFVVTGTSSLAATSFSVSPTAPTPTAGDNSTKVATTSFATTAIQALYPIGSIYTSTVSTNPNTLFGFGTWVAFGAGQVMIGNGSGFTAGSTGGSADTIVVSHTHTATSTVTDPGHTHTGSIAAQGNQSGGAYSTYAGYGSITPPPGSINSATTGITVATTNASTGVSGTNANLQPYIVVYMWNRTA